jgi:hypothetical protein
MQFMYSGFQIDTAPSLTDGKFSAQAVITKIAPLTREVADDRVSKLLPNMRTFDAQVDAVAFALYWAIPWIDKYSA